VGAEIAELESIEKLLVLSKELIALDVRAESYAEMLEVYCDAVEVHLNTNPSRMSSEDLEKVKGGELLNGLLKELVENHQLVLQRAVSAKEGIASDLAKLRRTKRGMLAYLSQSFDTNESP